MSQFIDERDTELNTFNTQCSDYEFNAYQMNSQHTIQFGDNSNGVAGAAGGSGDVLNVN